MHCTVRTVCVARKWKDGPILLQLSLQQRTRSTKYICSKAIHSWNHGKYFSFFANFPNLFIQFWWMKWVNSNTNQNEVKTNKNKQNEYMSTVIFRTNGFRRNGSSTPSSPAHKRNILYEEMQNITYLIGRKEKIAWATIWPVVQDKSKAWELDGRLPLPRPLSLPHRQQSRPVRVAVRCQFLWFNHTPIIYLLSRHVIR